MGSCICFCSFIIVFSCSYMLQPVSVLHSFLSMNTSNAEEAEVERFYEDLQDLLELAPKKDVLLIIGD